ncbi:unnamed protein product [Brassica napus]|uniref:(rape) hypothetical protein n=1 Tax=Brassica napus TaxID=3708 RepID=A0A816SD26_BRANA|nr:unnamed protein product [Brassica napus]
MDISAIASMKNVAKCDTWCELHNPINHQVFERKLRPKPSARGHVCLVKRSGPKALDDPKSSTRPQSGEASSTMDWAQVPWKGAPERAKYGREIDSEQVTRGKDEKDFEKRVKECLKLSGGKQMGASDSSRSDAERSNLYCRSIQAVDRRGLRVSACGLPIRTVLKHGPRSLTCVRVSG